MGVLRSLCPQCEKIIGEKRECGEIWRAREVVLKRAGQELHRRCRRVHGWRFSKALTMF